jgi:hypothetical protein
VCKRLRQRVPSERCRDGAHLVGPKVLPAEAKVADEKVARKDDAEAEIEAVCRRGRSEGRSCQRLL